MKIAKLTRRELLLAGATGAGGLALGVYGGHRLGRRTRRLPRPQPFAPNAFVALDTDDSVTIWVAKSEMGQGVRTALPMLVAEELEVDWRHVRVKQALARDIYGDQMTATSSSVRGSWDGLGQAGAAARQMLIQAAAHTWDVDPESCHARSSHVIHGPTGRRIRYGTLVTHAADLPVPRDIPLKSAREHRLLGKSLPRVDVPSKVDGTARFGLDVRLPGQVYASIERCPHIGGSLDGFDPSAANEVPGVSQVLEVPSGVAVVGKNTWAALSGRRALTARWNPGPHAGLSDDTIAATLADQAEHAGITAREQGDVEMAGDGANHASASFHTPYLAHAAMEPPNCTARVQDGRCEIWAPTQHPQGARDHVAELLGFDPGDVVVHTTLLGGGFGRRVMHDEVGDAAWLAKLTGKPVQVVWTREDDVRHDHFRPVMRHDLRAETDATGMPDKWHHRVIGPSILGLSSDEKLDVLAVDGASQLPYSIPNLRIEWRSVELPLNLGFWRSVGHSHTAFAIESFIDELAAKAGRDPIEFRLALLGSSPRHQEVLQRAADLADWAPDATRNRGVALHASFGSYVAEIADIEVDPQQRLTVKRVVAVVDCGKTVNPDTIRAQIEGGVIFGLSAALRGAINVEGGQIRQSNFHDYPVVRMGEAPDIEVHIVDSQADPGGIGEVAVPPVAPAVANAVFSITGHRLRRLPLAPDGRLATS